MPPRGKKPGFKIGRHNLPYWIAKQVVKDIWAFPDKCIPLPVDADDETLAALCHEHTARLYDWISERKKELDADASSADPFARVHAVALEQYTGTVESACRFYQTHPMSGFHTVKANTRRTYTSSLKLIESTVGARSLKRVTTVDVKHWYNQWRKPAVTFDKDGNKVIGPERIDRAHDATEIFRTVIRFLAALRVPEAKLLNEELKLVKFEKGGAREEELTFAQATAFIKKALEFGEDGTYPKDRALYLALGTAAQFELLLRQKDIIGERMPAATQADKRKLPKGATVIAYDAFDWAGFFTWERIPGWRWRMKTSKSKYRSAAEFDLTKYGLLMPLLEAVPHEQRTGPIIKDETDRPVRENSYRRWWRAVARAAGIPDNVWNMDSRAGGATEAEEAGAELGLISSAMTHTKETMTLRYIRSRSKKIGLVADIRQAERKKNIPPGGTR